MGGWAKEWEEEVLCVYALDAGGLMREKRKWLVD